MIPWPTISLPGAARPGSAGKALEHLPDLARRGGNPERVQLDLQLLAQRPDSEVSFEAIDRHHHEVAIFQNEAATLGQLERIVAGLLRDEGG